MTIHSAYELITPDDVIFWFRRDLRLEDNAGLYHALRSKRAVIPMFIFDANILDKLEDRSDRRVDFIHQTLRTLKQSLERLGSSLVVLYGDPADIFRHLTPLAVFANHDYEPYARERDESVRKCLAKRNIEFKTFKDHVIFERDEVLSGRHAPYTVFTPYSKQWKLKISKFYLKSYPVGKYFERFKKIVRVEFPTLEEIGFQPRDLPFEKSTIKLPIIRDYHKTRNHLSINGTSRLGVHLRFGTVSIRKLVSIAIQENETWLNELIWREFYQMILWHFPTVVGQCFKSAYERVAWRNDEAEFEAWCKGMTGYPIVDAGMRELNATGFMHNRARMIAASFLTKHLLIDWRWGEAYFAKRLLDYELASNNGGWQWAAGCGCDAAPYFRIFNPNLQAKKFDPVFSYTRKWIPEFGTSSYPGPIVAHAAARQRALNAYREAIRENIKQIA